MGPCEEFAQKLRRLREAQGLSIRRLAAQAGVSSVTIWKWEKGSSKPRPRAILALATALNIAPSTLIQVTGSAQLPGPGMELDFHAPAADHQNADPSPDQITARARYEGLASVVARAKQMIAEASGTGAGNVIVRIEY